MADIEQPVELKPYQIAPEPTPKTPEKFDPNAPIVYLEADQATKNTFGHNVKVHPVTLMPIEQGRGALPEHQQIVNHLVVIEREQGLKVADAMRKKLGIKTVADLAQAQQVVAEAEKRVEQKRFDEAVDARVKEIIANPPGLVERTAREWSPITTYAAGQKVISADGFNYIATRADNNIDKNPAGNGQPFFWMQTVRD